MPYACTMVGGRPLLTRAPEQGHRIIGNREQRNHTACSPANPEMCRNWTVHRFNLECEGARVPWVSVVASVAEETTRRAWIEDGRLVLRMPPAWSFEPGDPCARAPGFDDRLSFGRMRRYCADRRAMAPPPIVEMPFGFAPMLGIDGIFVRSSGPGSDPIAPSPPPVAAMPPASPPKVARTEPPPRAEPVPLPAARPEPPTEPVVKNTPAQSAPPPKAEVQATPQAAPPAPAVKPPPAPQTSPIAAAPGGPVIPKIINRPETASTDVPEQMRPATIVPKSGTSGSEASKAPSGAPSKEAAPQAPPKASNERDSAPITVILLSVVASPTTGVIAFGGLALVLLAAFAVARRRERLAGTHAHDIASVSLDRGGGQLVPRHGSSPAAHRPTGAAPSPPPAPAPPEQRNTPGWVGRIPQTKGEALQMLGMGVSRDATETAMKKIVDGLRLSWHPDLAKDESDRQLREFRIKQINAAWELIQGKRMERLDS